MPDNIIGESPAQDQNKQFGLRAVLTYSNDEMEYHYVPFNPDVTEWQFASLAIVPERVNKTVASIRVICAYEKNANVAHFDNLSLVKEVAQTMTYDADGNLVSVKSTGTNAAQNTYSNGNLTQVVTDASGTYTYGYDSYHNLTTAKNSVVKETYTYDGRGNITASSLTKADGTGASINSQAAYANNGNLVSSVTDARGKITRSYYEYALNKQTGLPSKVRDADSTDVDTTYYNDGRVKQSYISGVVSALRSYDSKLYLTKIDRGGYNNVTNNKVHQYYWLDYDAFGNTTGIRLGSSGQTTLGAYDYAAGNGLLSQMTYGNGAAVSYTYDNLGRTTQTETSSGDSYTYSYTGDGQLYEMTDATGGLIYRYTYDSLGRLIGSTMTSGGTALLQTWQKYDDHDRPTKQSWALPGASYSTNYSYDSNGRLHQLYHELPTGNTYNTLTYDDLGRLSIGYTTKYRKEFQYLAGNVTGSTTPLVSQLSLISSTEGSFPTKTYSFSYDNLGNISRIVGPEGTTDYTYDVLSQLTRASRNNQAEVWSYTYDNFGNIHSRTYLQNGVAGESLIYAYGDTNWLDKLTGISGTKDGTTFSGTYSYDGAGNPTSYYNVGDLSTWTLTWKNGRELAAAAKTGTSISYDYDVNGLRTQKTVDGVTHTYTYASGKLLREAWTESESGVDLACTLDFFYDYAGNPYIVFYTKGNSHQRFYYLTNLQGDVIGLLNTSSQLVAEYDYDPYGNLICYTGSSSGTELQQLIGQVNPLRYRGYYFDAETGWYYLQSRYYDPELGRFINADSFASTGQGFLGYNMFAYCGNNPVNGSDPTGQWIIAEGFEWIWDNAVEPAAEWVSDKIIEPIANYVTNDDPMYCENHFFSFYKCAPVFNIESQLINKLELTSWSYGVIVLNNERGRSDFEETLRHEYGHTVQMKILGVRNYTSKIAIPSIVYNLISRKDEDLNDMYYCMPWERTADYFGKVDNRSFRYSKNGEVYNDPAWILKCLEYLGG